MNNNNLRMTNQVLGSPVTQRGVTYCNGNPLIFSEYTVVYPDVVINALKRLYKEYNQAFIPLVEANREFTTDYQYCRTGLKQANCFVQIDMCGLTQQFLDTASMLSVDHVVEMVRNKIFEIENSLAVYQFLQNLFPGSEEESLFKQAFRAHLHKIQYIYNMPIALLAVTDQKYEEIKLSEFGKSKDELITSEEVKKASGFDCLLGPKEFKEHVKANNGKCKYLLYARTSDPLDKLKKPDFEVIHPLLSDPFLRSVIKTHSLTLNIDTPGACYSSLINDTKEYMPRMGMGYTATSPKDIFSHEFIEYLANGNAAKDYTGIYFSRLCEEYLLSCGVDSTEIRTGMVTLRGKPMKNAYGCYGHVSGLPIDKKFRDDLKSNLQKRGPYIIQPELKTPTECSLDGTLFTYIDRVFFATDGVDYDFIGGFRNFMPLDSSEGKRKRIHGNEKTVYAEIR